MASRELPPPPTLSGRQRVRFRLGQVTVAALTVLATAWCYQMNTTLGLAATFLAKHILVAVLATGLNLPDAPRR